METLVRGASEQAPDIDRRITEKSENWRLERMPAVDRNILRMAVYEMTDLSTPAPVVIDEALELARQFSGDESVSFINGVLDAVHREFQAAVNRPAGSAGRRRAIRSISEPPRGPSAISASPKCAW